MGSPLGLLRSSLSDLRIEEHAPIFVDDTSFDGTLVPGSGEELGACVSKLAELACPVVVCGGGSRLTLGNPPAGARALLSTRALAKIREFDEDDGVILCEGGVRIEEVEGRAAAAGWSLPLDAPGDASTVGGVLASAALGPRSNGFGPARDAVLGLEVVLGSGARTKCGGRVVKNVTGYDLAKLYTGSFGSLGVIESAWLRLRPAPERREVRGRTSGNAARAFEDAIASARLPTAGVSALLSPSVAGRLGLAAEVTELTELSGDAATVERDGATCGERANESIVAELRELQGEPLAGAGVRARISVLPSGLASLWQLLAGDPELALFAYPGVGLLYAGWRGTPDKAGFDKRVSEVCEGLVDSARRYGTSIVFEELPLAEKRVRDVFVDAPALEMQRLLKQQFDPQGILNPGRSAGGL